MLKKGYFDKGIKKLPENIQVVADSLYKEGRVLDANTGMFLRRELEVVLPNVLTMLHPNKSIMQIFSPNTSGRYSKYLIKRAKEAVGTHKRKTGKATTNGVITASYKSDGIFVTTYGASSYISIEDIKAGQNSGINIQQDLLEGHTESYHTIVNEIGMLGSSADNKSGLASNGEVTITSAGATFESLATAKDGMGIYEIVRKSKGRIAGRAGGNTMYAPNTLVLPPKQFQLCEDTILQGPSSSITSITVMQAIRNMGITNIYADVELVGAGANNKDRMILGNSTPQVVELMLPRPLEFAKPYEAGFNVRLESEFNLAGIFMYRPDFWDYTDGI